MEPKQRKPRAKKSAAPQPMGPIEDPAGKPIRPATPRTRAPKCSEQPKEPKQSRRKPAAGFVSAGGDRLKQVGARIKELCAKGSPYKEAQRTAWDEYRARK